MSKTVEQKAFEEYPKSYVDQNIGSREGYIKGYDQAMQDMLDKACEWLNDLGSKYLMISLETKLADLPTHIMIEQFKNYMENESEN